MDAAARTRALALAAPPLLWAAQGLSGWWLASRACPLATLGDTAGPGLSCGAARLAVGAITAAALVLTVLALRAAFLASARFEPPPETPDASPSGTAAQRAHYLAFAGTFVSATLTLGLAFAGLSTLFLATCGRGR
jgi:hypothetical protein